MSKPELTDVLEWPNGQGFTPCSREYADKSAMKDAIYVEGTGGLDKLSPEDYEAWNRLDSELMTMQASGEHLGKSERW